MIINNPNDYAWWEVGDSKFNSKFLAVFEQAKTQKPIKWNVNDQLYDQYQWNIEPAKNLDDLYAERARGIREKYDYLVLHFSGGSDSCNILETFIKNKIHLDEIIVRGSYSTVDQKTGVGLAAENFSECLTQSLPLATWAKDNHMPHLKISVVDTVEFITNYFNNNPEWFESAVDELTPSNIIRSKNDSLCPHYQTLLEKGKSIAHIFGIEKPRIFKKDNYFYTQLPDKHLGGWASSSNIGQGKSELFYWGPNAIELQIKQLHVIKNYIKLHNIPDHMFDVHSGRPYENFVASVIYNRTLPLYFEHLKDPGRSLILDRDFWFANDKNSDYFKTWYRGADYLKTLMPTEWHDQQGFWTRGLLGLNSKPRYLGK